jgi:peroxiredoxin
VGGALTVLILAGIIITGIVRANAASSSRSATHGAALTNAAALNPAASLLSTGSVAPSFTLKDVNSKTYSLAAQRGHPVLLEFFAVWCPHCQHEAQTIQQINQKFAAKGVRVWSILANPYGPNYDNSFGTDTTPATKGDLAWFSRTFGEHVPQLVDPSFHVVNEYGVSGYPGIYVINKQGVIVNARSGEQSYATLAQALDRALRGS